ncbi:hypothetical protein RINGS_54 [Arthrobacter phage Rings]|uniref:Uncharacterized protein n=1 Tax=Arthrobacter phage Rings TaxID=1772313 RepID=A0A0U4KA59_9CAUD|nr:hypothetical protein RINGS_54 [Arthrobacter phage Rings]
MDPITNFVFIVVMCGLSWLSGYWIAGGTKRRNK